MKKVSVQETIGKTESVSNVGEKIRQSDSQWHRAANCSTGEILTHWRFGHQQSQGVFSALPAAVSSLTSAVVCWGCRQHDEGHQWGTEAQGHAVKCLMQANQNIMLHYVSLCLFMGFKSANLNK